MGSFRGGARSLVVALGAVAACMAIVVAPSSAAAEEETPVGAAPSCASKLVACGGYLNGTAAPPPASCCGPLKDAAANETACLCAILTNRAALRAFGVAPEQGMLLAKRCGVATGASACAKYTATTAAAGAGIAGSTAASSASTGSTAASSASTGNAASTVVRPTESGGVTHRLSFISAAYLVGFSFIWWTTIAQ